MKSTGEAIYFINSWICAGCQGNRLDQESAINAIDQLLPAFTRVHV